MKINKIFTMTALCLALSACNDSDETQFNVDGGIAITGQTISGQTLTATVSDINGLNQTNVSYQWLSNGTEISGATSNSYILTNDDIGSTITVSANYTDNDNNDEAVTSSATDPVEDIAVNVAGSVEITGTAESGQELTATVTDDNGLPEANLSYAWLAGTDTIGTNASTVTLTDAEIGKTVTVTVTYIDNDDFSENVVSATTDAVIAAVIPDTPAEFTGNLSVEITSDIASDATGTITVTDINDGEASFQAVVDAATTYGTFSITAAGVWTYTLDTANATIAAFTSAADRETDSITLTSFDGTTTTLNIAINGVGGGVTLNKVATITDAADDSLGQLRVALEDTGLVSDVVIDDGSTIASVESGKMTFSFNAEDIGNSSYFALYGIRTNLIRAMLELRFKENGKLFVRDGGDEIELSQTFVEGEWVDVAVTWDTTLATDSVAPTLTLTIDDIPVTSVDGTSITAGTFSSLTTDEDTVQYGVTNIKYIVGTSSEVVTGQFHLDDIKIYHDTAGTTTPLAFEQDFETSDLGAIDPTVANSIYHGNTSQVTIESQTVPAGN